MAGSGAGAGSARGPEVHRRGPGAPGGLAGLPDRGGAAGCGGRGPPGPPSRRPAPAPPPPPGAGEGGAGRGHPGLATGRGWQPVHGVEGGREWAWNSRGPAPMTLPGELEPGFASGAGMQCLVDSLRQLMQRILPEAQRGQMTRAFLADWFRRHLPLAGEALGELMDGQMIDVHSVLTTFTDMFQVRVQV